jgi:hypothetical protein
MNKLRSIAICKIIHHRFNILFFLPVLAIFSFSCNRKPVVNTISHAIIEYQREVYRGYKYIPVQINEPTDINIVENVMTTKEVVSAKFPRKQYLTIVFTDGVKVRYSINNFVFRDSNHCYAIPEGELREKFVNLINVNEPLEDNSVSPANKLSVRGVQ